MIGTENLVITENDENDTTTPVNFEKAIAVIFTVRVVVRERMRALAGSDAVLDAMFNSVQPRTRGFPENKLEKDLPKVEVPENMVNEKCSICLEEFQEKEQVTQLQCGHFFHRDCGKHWLVEKSECPLCRKDLTEWDFKPAPNKVEKTVDEKTMRTMGKGKGRA
ncbi:ring finger domain-containing protein [Ditylenchus destructor]|uniref:RING-type E3 ubiquitin transferase n=1 Tax=Ditylenchus destructor TaxID=166010 RepID=A0AAD4MQ26_9BILA|nr:ring finger domain-containing protein [Ditylenchus destructor]